MPTVVAVEDNRLSLAELVDTLAPGQEVVLTRDRVAVAKLVRSVPVAGLRPPPGLGKGMITVVADDDDHLAAFQEYAP